VIQTVLPLLFVLACHHGNEALIKYLVENNAIFYKANSLGDTPLNVACRKGLETNVKYLVEHGASVHEVVHRGGIYITPFLHACSRIGNEPIVNYLVEQGIRLNWVGDTSLIAACAAGNETIVKYLVEERGADVDLEMPYLSAPLGTPLTVACKFGHETIVNYLVEQGANIHKEVNGFGNPLIGSM